MIACESDRPRAYPIVPLGRVEVSDEKKLDAKSFGELIDLLGRVSSSPGPFVDASAAAEIFRLVLSIKDLEALLVHRFWRWQRVADPYSVGAFNRQWQGLYEFLNRREYLRRLSPKRKRRSSRECFAGGLSGACNLVARYLGDVVVAQNEQDFSRIGDLQPRSPKKHFDASVLSGPGVGRAVEYLLKHQASRRIFLKARAGNDTVEGVSVSVQVASDDHVQLAFEMQDAPFAAIVFSVEDCCLSEDIGYGAGQD